MNTIRAATMMLVLALTASAWAQDAKDKDLRQFKAEKQLAKRAAETGEKCGAQIEVDLDYASFGDKNVRRYSIASWCEHVLAQLTNLCRGPKTKAHIAKRVRQYRCTMATDGRKLTIDDAGKVTLFIDFKRSNYGEFARRELVRKL